MLLTNIWIFKKKIYLSRTFCDVMKLIGYKHCRSLRWIPCDSIFVSPGRMSLILSRQFNLEEQFTFAKQTLGMKKNVQPKECSRSLPWCVLALSQKLFTPPEDMASFYMDALIYSRIVFTIFFSITK